MDVNSIKQALDEFEAKLVQIEPLAKLKAQIKLPIIYVLLGVFSVFLLGLYVFSGLRAISSIVGFVYPAYQSLVALSTDDKDDDKLWLSYWVFYGLFTVIESITDILFFWLGSLYEFSKIAFFVYLFAPQIQGAIFLYDKVLKPYVDESIKFTDRMKADFAGVKNVFDKQAKELSDSLTKGGPSEETKKSS